MYNSCLDTIFIGKYLTYLPSCHSTNDIAAQLGREGAIQEGHVIITDFQSAGRGQRESRWVSDSGQNFLFSIYLQPHFLAIEEQFSLSMAMALAVRDFLQQFTSTITVKWPNDVYIGASKCAGMLIENTVGSGAIKRSVVGIGININQLEFEHSRITSLRLQTGQEYHLNVLLPSLLKQIENHYLVMQKVSFNELKETYLHALLGYNTKRAFKDINGHFNATIIDVTPQGMLVIERENGTITTHGLKELEWLF